MKNKTRFWISYVFASLILIAAFSWLSWALLGVVDRELVARRDREHQERLSEAIWRLDLWLAPLLGIEAMRPATDYSPTMLSITNLERNDAGIEQREGLTISPLVKAPSDYFPFHFEISEPTPEPTPTPDPEFQIMACSPQVPSEPDQSWFIANGVLTQAEIGANQKVLDHTASLFSDPEVLQRFSVAEERTLELLAAAPSIQPVEIVPEATGTGFNMKMARNDGDSSPAPRNSYGDWTNRAQATRHSRVPDMNSNIQLYQGNPIQTRPIAEIAATPGPLVPLWVTSEESSERWELIVLRKVPATGTQPHRYQGFLVDWPKLSASLLEQIDDLVIEAEIRPVPSGTPFNSDAGRMLATIPAGLSIVPIDPSLEASALPGWTLLATWSAVALALLGFGFGFRSIIAFSEKRSRFASAVTHELRTPLTTFQLYSEMLADGMVGEERRQEYLQTLSQESRRLSSVVENVLAYAQVEDGHHGLRVVDTTVGDLVERVRAEVERRANEAEMKLSIELEAEPDLPLRTDPDAIGHVVTNLTDNACKYANSDEESSIRIRISAETDALCIRVEDDGPGIPAEQERTIFAPFERAGRESSNIPGVGLGLSLSRNLATQLGGTLRYHGDQSGACFELRVPRA